MSSSSYLGHGAKYWADHYFELQTQTRMPDDSNAIEWREKYLGLEKSCSLYQSKIADLRTEVEYLRQKAPPEPELYEGHNAEYWYKQYFSQLAKNHSLPKIITDTYAGQTAEYWYNACTEAQNRYTQLSLEELKGNVQNPVCYKGSTAEEWAHFYDNECQENGNLHREIRSLNTRLMTAYNSSDCDGHDSIYWNQQANSFSRQLKKQQQHFRLLFIFLTIIAISLFFAGLCVGEGYFVPHYTPSSPYIERVQRDAKSSGYDNGYNFGTKEGFSEGYRKGKKNGYEQGYNDGLNRKPKDVSRWTIGDAATLREGLTNTNK